MTTTKVRAAVAIVMGILAVGAAFSLAGSADPPKPAASNPPAADEKEKKPVEHRGPIGPGISALVAASTDIIVADVLETNPRKAIEGARDTVRLKVVRPLLGRLTSGDEIGVYYHLLWQDEASTVLEPPKFERGKRYVLFLKSHIEDRREEGKRTVYELTDQWFAVHPDHVRLVKEAVAAIRVHHGDSRGEWSSSEGSIAGLQGRLVVYRNEPSNGTPILAVYLEARNTAGGDNTVEFAPERSGMKWVMTDADGKPVRTTAPAGDWLPTPRLKLTLVAQESGRLNLTVTGAGIMKDRGGHLELGSEAIWVFDKGARGPYYLSGTITIPATGERGKWYGTLELPKVRVPLGAE